MIEKFRVFSVNVNAAHLGVHMACWKTQSVNLDEIIFRDNQGLMWQSFNYSKLIVVVVVVVVV